MVRINHRQKEHWTLRNESTKQSEYDLHRSVARQCAHSKLKKIEIVLPQQIDYEMRDML